MEFGSNNSNVWIGFSNISFNRANDVTIYTKTNSFKFLLRKFVKYFTIYKKNGGALVFDLENYKIFFEACNFEQNYARTVFFIKHLLFKHFKI
jgi:hypothetical protein